MFFPSQDGSRFLRLTPNDAPQPRSRGSARTASAIPGRWRSGRTRHHSDTPLRSTYTSAEVKSAMYRSA
jgi:hypothetical protein